MLNRKLRATLFVVLSGWAGTLQAAELLYFFSPHCGACQKFEREIASIYEKTSESRKMPIKKILFEETMDLSDYELSGAVFATPTFVAINESGRELDRITGYSDDELFWLSLRRLYNKAVP